jgi:hypothetical protein
MLGVLLLACIELAMVIFIELVHAGMDPAMNRWHARLALSGWVGGLLAFVVLFCMSYC